MSVKRYEVNGTSSVFEDETGSLVDYKDYAALEQRLIESERYGRQTDITIDNLEMKLAQMAAENAGLKAIVSGINNKLCGKGFIVSAWHLNGALKPLDNWFNDNRWGEAETPATDAFLAEVRAEGVEMFADSLGSPYVERGEECYQDGYTHAIERIKSHKAPEFAAQLRKGVQS